MKDDSTVWSTITWYQAFSVADSASGPRLTFRGGASVPLEKRRRRVDEEIARLKELGATDERGAISA